MVGASRFSSGKSSLLLESRLPGDPYPVRRGKVRDIYDLGDRLLMVSTDRISAFDWVLPSGIPDKGRVLTQLSAFWFERLAVPHHVLSLEVDEWPLPEGTDKDALRGRSMIVRKARVVPIECVVRGYLEGSGWKEYCQRGSVCGVTLPSGLPRGAKLPQPIFTPATKAQTGHDVNIDFAEMCRLVGAELAERLRSLSLRIYEQAAAYAEQRGILIADTKLEWGFDGDTLLLIDEVLTPDSSRFWPTAEYEPGRSQVSFDKQFVRDWLIQIAWDQNSPPPPLPDDIVRRTRDKYIEAYERLTGQRFPWNHSNGG